MRHTTVLVVEDDTRVAQVIADQLREEDCDVYTASTVKAAEQALAARAPDVVVLDVMLPDGSGFDLCRTIRRGGRAWHAAVAILLLTARVDEADVLRGFERGADDYIRKPFSMLELVARVHALSGRRGRSSGAVLDVGGLRIDLAGRVASYRGARIDLAAKEFALLAELALDPGAVRTKQELLARVWDCDGMIRTRTVDSHASRLRKKLAAAGVPGDTVVNSWGRGYRLEIAHA